VDLDELFDRLKRGGVATEGAGHDDDGPRAAVAAILRPGADAGELLLIRRAERVGDPWSGHMAFPGGRRDAGESVLETAIRETREEVGLDLRATARLVTRMPDVQAMTQRKGSHLVVVPFVFRLERDAELVPNEEVAEALWTPFGPMLRGEGAKVFPYEWQGTTHQLPSIDVGGRIVWGLTHRMIEVMREAIEKPR
jgi:8-oxo-dGTP pyrophosphatase MutT (NUDIX family)